APLADEGLGIACVRAARGPVARAPVTWGPITADPVPTLGQPGPLEDRPPLRRERGELLPRRVRPALGVAHVAGRPTVALDPTRQRVDRAGEIGGIGDRGVTVRAESVRGRGPGVRVLAPQPLQLGGELCCPAVRVLPPADPVRERVQRDGIEGRRDAAPFGGLAAPRLERGPRPALLVQPPLRDGPLRRPRRGEPALRAPGLEPVEALADRVRRPRPRPLEAEPLVIPTIEFPRV